MADHEEPAADEEFEGVGDNVKDEDKQAIRETTRESVLGSAGLLYEFHNDYLRSTRAFLLKLFEVKDRPGRRLTDEMCEEILEIENKRSYAHEKLALLTRFVLDNAMEKYVPGLKEVDDLSADMNALVEETLREREALSKLTHVELLMKRAGVDELADDMERVELAESAHEAE